jgi:hypothetical protein
VVFFRSFFLLFALSFLFFVTLSAERVILSAVEGRRAFLKKQKRMPRPSGLGQLLQEEKQVA